jgi:hypothetical protein
LKNTGRLGKSTILLNLAQLDRQRSGDVLRNRVLHREHVLEFSVVALGPEMHAARGVDELRRNSHSITSSSHAALQEVANAQFTGDLLRVRGLAFESQDRVARDNREIGEAAEGRNEILGDTVAEILLLRILAPVHVR